MAKRSTPARRRAAPAPATRRPARPAAATAADEHARALLERLVTVQEEERRRIARNLHDQLGQQMTALRLTIDALKEDTLPEVEFRRRLDLLDRLAAQIDRDVDYIARDLRPPALDDVGLNAALEALVCEWSAAQGIPAEFHVFEPDAIRLLGEIESHLYRIVQEALNNVAKHAAATHVSVLVERRGEDVTVIIEDDGLGFDVDQAVESREPNRGMGLAGMHERASLVGGSVQVESARGRGTTVFIRLPIRKALMLPPKA